jgi:hypothetical protein
MLLITLSGSLVIFLFLFWWSRSAQITLVEHDVTSAITFWTIFFFHKRKTEQSKPKAFLPHAA